MAFIQKQMNESKGVLGIFMDQFLDIMNQKSSKKFEAYQDMISLMHRIASYYEKTTIVNKAKTIEEIFSCIDEDTTCI
jgi:hypothetical protein